MRNSLRRALVAAVALTAAVAPAARAQDSEFEPVVEGLDFAVNVAFLPDGGILIAEKASGAIRLARDGRLLAEPFATLPVDATNNETGLLGLAVSPAFRTEPYVYTYFSDLRDGMNRLVRFRVEGDDVGEPETLFDEIATTGIHNGGDLAFGLDGALFLVTGDGAAGSTAQDLADPRGKVLRFRPDGSIPSDNPIPGSPVYAAGIRNSFGLCVDPQDGTLFETENGPEAWDELNEIVAGANHGWPTQLGPGGEPELADPVIAWEDVIVATGCAITPLDDGAVYVGDLRGALHRIAAREGTPTDELVGTFEGGITDVAVGPDDALYVLTTSALYRATGGTGGGSAETATPDAGTPSPSPPPSASTTADGGDDAGLGSALGSTAGVVVLVLLAAGFLWLRSKALRR